MIVIEKMPNENAFEMAVSNIRFGAGVTREVGMDLADLGVRRVLVLTDPGLKSLRPVQTVLQSLDDNKVAWTLYDRVRVEIARHRPAAVHLPVPDPEQQDVVHPQDPAREQEPLAAGVPVVHEPVDEQADRDDRGERDEPGQTERQPPDRRVRGRPFPCRR